MHVWWVWLLLGCVGEADQTATDASATATASHSETGDTAAAGWALAWEPTAATYDACEAACAAVSATLDGAPAAWVGWTVEASEDGFVASGTLDGEGGDTVCLSGLSVGTQSLVFTVGAWGEQGSLTTDIDVRPFGWAYGLDKSAEAITELPWTPEFTESQLTAEPVLEPSAEDWDSKSVMMPSTVTYDGVRFLYFAGTDDEVFHLGVASDDGGGLERYAGNPILEAQSLGSVEGDWNYYAQNTPEAVVVDDEIRLYYNGRRETAGGLVIGLATSTDGVSFTDIEDNPLFEPTGVEGDFDEGAVAHPSIRVTEPDFDAGYDRVFELWYASGTLEIGYALSSDGLTWERYCDGPVFQGDSTGWDDGNVKAPEVVHDGEHYFMTYSGCGQGCYQVGWAASSDGIRWVAAEEPLIPVQEPPGWNSFGTQAAFVENEEETWRFWYTGTGTDAAAIGYLESEREAR